jgi:chromosome segregation ATPase
MKKLRPQVSADLVERVKGEFGSFEEGLRELINYCDFLGEKLNDTEKAIRKQSRKFKEVVENHSELSDKYYALSDRYSDLFSESWKSKAKLKEWDELREKYNREVHRREMLEIKHKQLKCESRVNDAEDFSDIIAVLFGLDKEMLDNSQSMTIRTEKGQIYVDLEGHMPLAKVIY